jgi:hypothetical protein
MFAAGACSGEENQYDYSEPIVVHGAQFFTGELPGSPPTTTKCEGDSVLPCLNGISGVLDPTIYSGESNWPVGGDVSTNTSSVAIRLGTLGTGYWVLPVVLGLDPSSGRSAATEYLQWSASIDFNASDPPGNQLLRVVAINADGTAGEQAGQPLCLASNLPSVPGRHSFVIGDTSACSMDGGIPQQSVSAAAVFSLTWDSDLDVDLHVVTPEGEDVSAKGDPFVLANFVAEGGADGGAEGGVVEAGMLDASAQPSIDRDSIGYCVADNWREEDLLFPTLPAPGSLFELYANLFSACGFPSASFTMTVYVNEGGQLVKKLAKTGVLPAAYALGSAPGLYVASYTF